MKKILLSAIALIAMINSIYGQNTYPFPSSGNIGIGTTGPEGILDVYGTGYFGFQDYRSQAVQKVLVLRAEGVNSVYSPSRLNFYMNPGTTVNGISSLDIKSIYGSDPESGVLFKFKGNGDFYASGNVGIGTTTPSAKLEIGGNMNIFPTSNYSSAATARQITIGEASNNSAYRLALGYYQEASTGVYTGVIQSTHGGAGNNLTLNPTGGNVGIGTVIPGGKLDIASNTSIGTSDILEKYTWISDLNNWGLRLEQQFNASLGRIQYNWIMRGGAAADIPMMSFAGGNVGIGTTNPRAKFSIISATDNNGAFFPAKDAIIVGQDNTLASGSVNLGISSNSAAGIDIGASIGFGGLFLSPGDIRDVGFGVIKGAKENSTLGDPTGYMAFGTYTSSVGIKEKMRITSTGSVAIGTTDPKGYKLAVAGNAIAESMTVKLQANWPDVVFKKDYALMPLSEVKTYIDKNQHLPEIPAAAEVEKDGVNLGEMNRLLVKKVEEMTLYLIELNKTVKEQQSEIDQLKKQINAKE